MAITVETKDALTLLMTIGKLEHRLALYEPVIEAAEALSTYWESGGQRDEAEEQRLFDAVLDTTAALQAATEE